MFDYHTLSSFHTHNRDDTLPSCDVGSFQITFADSDWVYNEQKKKIRLSRQTGHH